MDFLKMLENWRRIMARSVFVFHIVCAVLGLVVMLSVISVPYLWDQSPGSVELITAAVTGLLCLLASFGLGGAVRYAVYGDFKLLPSRSFRDYFSSDDHGDESSAYIAPPLPERSQRGPDDDLVDRSGELVSSGDVDGYMELYNRLQTSETLPPGEISKELAPRIRELGLERNCEELWEQGYTVIEDVAPPEYWRDLRGAIIDAGYPYERGSILMEKYPIVAEAAINPKMMAIAEFSVGAGFILSNVASTIRRKGDRNIGLHCDQIWHPVPFPESNLFLTACWACDDFTLEAGATTVVPGSAALRRPPSLDEVSSTATVPIESKAGSIALWDGRTWHNNATRTIDGERAVLHVSYTRLAMRQMEVYPRSVQDRLVEQFGEPMAQLMSRYDFLGKPEGKAYADGFMRTVAYARR